MAEALPAYQVYTVDVEDGGHDSFERAFRFIGGILTAAFGGNQAQVLGRSVVVRKISDGTSHLHLEVPDGEPENELLATIRQDLNEMTAAEFEQAWLHAEHEGRHIKGPRH